MPDPAAERARALPPVTRETKPKQNPKDVARLALVALVTVGLGVGYFFFLRASQTYSLVSACPPVTTRHLAFVAATTESGETTTWHDAIFVVIDAVTGTLVAKHELGRFTDDADRFLCMGVARPGTVWLRRADDALEIRDGNTGAVTVSNDALVRATPAMRVGVQSLGWDPERAAPTMMLRDGHSLVVDPATLETSRFDGNVTLNPFQVRADEVVRSQSVPYYVGGMPGLVLADGRRITLEGHPRSSLVVDGQKLFGERDFYMPAMLVHPRTGRVEWPDPPSLVIVEETLIGSLRYRITRIGLDGHVLYSVDSGESIPGSWRYRPTPWTSAADGTRFVHFGAEGILAIDPASGRELYRISYTGEREERD